MSVGSAGEFLPVLNVVLLFTNMLQACVSAPPKTQSAMDIMGRDLRLLQSFRGKNKTAVAFG